MLRFLSLFFGCLLLSSACSWHDKPRPSVLIVAVDSLGFDQVICSGAISEPNSSGIRTLCQESVQFTHAYTPSVLTTPTMASLLTGRYPHEHGVWHNGPKFLSAKFKTSAEFAVERGYRTAFLSGGPPVWSYSGLNQGFEWFSDHFDVRHNFLYRPARTLFAEFLSWQENRAEGDPFFGFVYLADLQFPEIETTNDLGEVRSKNYQGQLQEVDESLAELIVKMKKKNIWNSTHFVLVGVNGVANPQKRRELKGFNVFSSNARVALFVKPAGKKRDLGLRWKIDKNVSLVDLGATVYEFLGVNPPAVSDRQLEVIPLNGALDNPTASWSQERMILTESAWPQWLGIGNSRFSIRAGHLLYVFDQSLKVYNTFVDQFEVAPMSDSELKNRQETIEIVDYLENRGFEPWSGVNSGLVEKWRIGSELFKDSSPLPEVILALQGVYERRPWDDQVNGWMAALAIHRGQWQELSRLGQAAKKEDWIFFANRALGKEQKLSPSGCLSLFLKKRWPLQRPSPKVCDDQVFVSLLMWLSKEPGSEADQARARFFRLYRYRYLDQTVFQKNLHGQLLWNVDVSQPAGPDLVSLTLALPEFSNAKKRTLAFLKRM